MRLQKNQVHLAIIFTDKVSDVQIRTVQKAGIRIAEIRLDRFQSSEPNYVLKTLKRFKGFWTIATIRSKKEGGIWTGTDHERQVLFEAILPKVDAVDIELSSKKILKSVVTLAHRYQKTVLISYHDFKKTPSLETLTQIDRKARNARADVVKIATKVNNFNDIQTLARWTLAHQNQQVIAIGMGLKGVSTRILFPTLGSILTYAHLETPTAPGQMNYWTIQAYFKQIFL